MVLDFLQLQKLQLESYFFSVYKAEIVHLNPFFAHKKSKNHGNVFEIELNFFSEPAVSAFITFISPR